MSKAGFKGVAILSVSMLAITYGAKASTGIMMPLLMVADVFAVYHYRNDIVWSKLKVLLPWMMLGVIVAVFAGDYISEQLFKRTMAIIIICSGVIMLSYEKFQNSKVSKSNLVAVVLGLLAGFTTMIGNLAGAFSNLYFLAMNFPKKKFIGTAAILFFIINLFKLPFHIFVWETINQSSIKQSLILVPFVLIGFAVGLKGIKYLNEKLFKRYIILVTILGAILILLR